MESLIVEGKTISGGVVRASGNKNAVLPMISALLLCKEPVVLHNVPDIRDVRTMLDIAEKLGVEYTFADNTLTARTPEIRTSTIDSASCAKNRTSILFAATLLARTGTAELYPPGGDVIGHRRLDGHFYGLKTLGAKMDDDPIVYRFRAENGLSGRELFLDECSVTATEQIILAAVTASGTTTLYNAASEPHVGDLANLLNAMGAKISGIGSNTLTIVGVSELHGVEYTVISDHIEAGSFLALGVATGVPIEVTGVVRRHYWMLRRVFERLGVEVELRNNSVYLPGNQKPEIEPDFGGHIPQISDGPWPQYPSDMMSCTIVAATQCKGTIMFFEKMFESRIYFTDRLISMGASAIVCDPHRVVITGPAQLRAVEMSSPDIRAGMAMVIAAACATGTSKINHAEIIYRGYENLVEKLSALGMKIRAERD